MGEVLNIGDGLALPLEAVTETFAILAKRGSGKALAVTTPIPTPAGWSTMGELAAGDEVLNELGRPCRVTAAHQVQHGRACYRVSFSDGAEVIADGEHLWRTEDLHSRLADQNAKRDRQRGRDRRPQCDRRQFHGLVTTEQISATLRHGKRGDLNHAIATTASLDLPPAELPIPPYTLGAWLGDGTRSTAVITSADPAVLDHVRADGFLVHPPYVNGDRTPSYRVGKGPGGRALNTTLLEYNLIDNKHIPAVYLRASAPQRLALLQGLMDTDGWRESGSAHFVSTTERLADDVHELAVSLGWKACRRKRPARLDGVDHGTAHQVSFRPDRQPFRLSRKTLPLGESQSIRHARRMVRAVEPVESVPVRCIAVDSESHLFLAGRDMVPTHNTYTAAVMVEEMLAAALPVVVVDPVGVWWGLRSSSDGDGPGQPVVIFGGDHADLPLTEGSGTLLADVVVDDRIPAVFDLSSLSKSASRRFMADFAERLYQRNRQALHVVIDEADAFAPQRVDPGQQRLLGAIEDLVRRGRARGLGATLITQRPAVLHKDVLSQAEVLIALRMTGPRDVAAIDEWVRLHADDDDAAEVKRSLPSLPVGTAWVWSPGWLGILQRVEIRARNTFDSSATPKAGELRAVPRAMAAVDLAALGERIAELEEHADRAAGDNPTALRARIADLQQQLRDRPVEPERIEVAVVSEAHVAALSSLVDGLREALDAMASRLDQVTPAATPASPPVLDEPALRVLKQHPPAPTPPAPRRRPRSAPDARREGPGGLPRAQRLILNVLAQHRSPLTAQQVAILAGYSAKGGGFASALGALRSAGFVEGPRERLTATEAGLERAGDVPQIPAGGAELVEHWIDRLSKAPAALLRALLDADVPLSAEQLAEAAGYAVGGGGFASALGRLRTLDLAVGDRGAIAASQHLRTEPTADLPEVSGERL